MMIKAKKVNYVRLTLLNLNAANDITLKYLKQNLPRIQGNVAKSTNLVDAFYICRRNR